MPLPTNAFHVGGANQLMGDGSVRFNKSTLDIRTFARLLTRANGEVVSSDPYCPISPSRIHLSEPKGIEAD